MKRLSIVAWGTVAVVAVLGVVYGVKSSGGAKLSVVAIVNGKTITAADIDPLLAAGLAKPVAVESAITKALGAEAALAAWPKEAETVAEAGAREALANFYMRKRLAELQATVSEEEISRYYDINIKDEMYSGQLLKYYLTQDSKDANGMADATKNRPDSVSAKFSWVNRDGDHGVLPVAIPYGLYSQVKTMQPGQYAGPFSVRDGLLFFKLEDRKPGKRPELSKVKEEIRAVLAKTRLEEEVKELRTKANIHLK